MSKNNLLNLKIIEMKVIFVPFIGYEVSWDSLRNLITRFVETAPTSYPIKEIKITFISEILIFIKLVMYWL
jgi:hypothetical protein